MKQEFADAWDGLAAIQFDVGHEGLVGQATGAVLQVKARGTQRAQVGRDPLGHGLGGSDIEGALWPGLVCERLFCGGEAALDGHEPDQLAPVRPELFMCLFVGWHDLTRSVYADRERRSAIVRECLLEQRCERGEVRRASHR